MSYLVKYLKEETLRARTREKVRCMSQEHSIRKVKVLQGRAKDEAEKQGLDPDDLVIVTTSVHPLPEYHIEKIEGDPVSFLLKTSRGIVALNALVKYLKEETLR